MCGIFGGSAIKGKKLNLHKLIILGLYNISRGTDSCGYYYNGNIVKGVLKEANFASFISNNFILSGDLESEVFMGHTRKSTSGGNTENNAHPHLINDDYVQTHNGVLANHWALCNKYEVDHRNITVDSIALANLIDKRGFDILNEYRGYAALAMIRISDPNKLFLFKGASREIENGQLITERPLFILKQKEGLYYSSMFDSLLAIADEDTNIDEDIDQLPTNIVFKVEHGIISPYMEINRDNNNIDINKKVYTQPTVVPVAQKPVSNIDNHSAKDLVLLEDYPINPNSIKVYYRYGRFHMGADNLLDGKFMIARKTQCVVNLDNPEKASTEFFEELFFVRGVMMKSEADYRRALSHNLNENITNINVAKILSNYSRYPVFNIDNEAAAILNENRTRWWFNGNVVIKDNFSPKFSDKIYTIKNGKTFTIVKSEGNKDEKVATAN